MGVLTLLYSDLDKRGPCLCPYFSHRARIWVGGQSCVYLKSTFSLMAHPAAICNPRILRPLGLLPDYDTGVHFPRPKGMLCKAQMPDLDDLREWAQGNPMVVGGSQSWETIETRTFKDELWMCTHCLQELGIDLNINLFNWDTSQYLKIRNLNTQVMVLLWLTSVYVYTQKYRQDGL